MSSPRILILPGWQGSGPGHWQTLWQQQQQQQQQQQGWERVEQHDWQRPLRGDWSIQLEEALLASEQPAVLVAHSLGCILVAAWASHSRHTARVRAALLVAPADTERSPIQAQLPSWSPIPRQGLPFPSVLVASRNDPYCDFERARSLAQAWGSRLVDQGEAGHINADSGLGAWPQGLALLQDLIKN